MTTGFYTAATGFEVDVDSLFAPGDTGQNTGLLTEYRGGQIDLGRLFAPSEHGSELPYQTGFIALDGRDLSQWFAAAGTVIPAWPIGGGFRLFQSGTLRFTTDTIVTINNRLGWAVYGDGSDTPTSNPITFHNNPCPGVEGPNASAWIDYGGYQRGVTRRLPAGAVLRFEYGTTNLPGFATVDRTVGVGDWSPGWTPVHTGPVNLCSNAFPYYTDPANFNGMSPGAGLYYGSFVPYMSYTSSRNWALVLAAAFCVSQSSGTLGDQNLYVTRIA
jgi:hypothetical protein